MIKNIVHATGKLNLTLVGPDGRVKESHDFDNLVVDTGLAFIASRIIDAASPVMSHMAIGSTATAPSTSNTTLGSELGRVALASAGSAGAVATYVASFPPGTGTGAITEAGIFNNAAGGSMLNRVAFAVVNKAAGDTLTITWTVTFS